MPRKLAKSKIKGWLRGSVGFERLLDGTVRPTRFYLSKDEDAAKLKKERLELEWKRVQEQGYEWWPDEVLSMLEREGVVAKRRQRPQTTAIMLGVIPKGEEMKPFVDEATGLIRSELAPQLMEYITQKLISNKDAQLRYAEAFHNEFMKDPLTAMERAFRLFGWGKDKIQQQFNFTGVEMKTNQIIDDSEMVDGAVVDVSDSD